MYTTIQQYYEISLTIPGYWLLLGCFLGLSIGSFINAAAYRIPLKKSLLTSSACPVCKQPIKPYDNIPLISYILLRGRCRHCKTGISLQYPIIELLGAFIGIFSLWYIGSLYGLIFFLIGMYALYFFAVHLTHRDPL